MRSLAAALSVLLLLAAVSCTGHNETTQSPDLSTEQPPAQRALTGQVLLPAGEGPRGVELWITTQTQDQPPDDHWVRFDEAGRFEHPLPPGRQLTNLTLSAAGTDVFLLETDAFPDADDAGTIGLGTIDLRDRLIPHKLTLRAAQGAPQGDIRAALWPGPPPTGPRGGSVSLGSAQFPTLTLGDETQWLLPPNATTIYLLVERPANNARGRNWRSGYQQQFGPYTTNNFPNELHIAGD
ncbi:hypothetical protein OT109_00275 [Phycisphaeraceae bacterium D3-23]